MLAVEAGLSLVDQTKIITAASELARNTLDYGGGGEVHLKIIDDAGRRGVRLTFEDRGPGIADIQQALKDGFTSGSGLGLGLGGARRLSNEFYIESKVGVGTKITISALEEPDDRASHQRAEPGRRGAARGDVDRASKTALARAMPAGSRSSRPSLQPI